MTNLSSTRTIVSPTPLAAAHRAARALLLLPIVAIGALNPLPLRAQATFTGLGVFGGYESVATDVSADGSVVVGFSEPYMFRWTKDASLLQPHPKQGHAALSADGSVISGIFLTPEGMFEPFRWTVGESFKLLGDLPGGPEFPLGRALDISADGRTVVGHGTNNSGEEAFRWTAETGMVGLGDLAGGSFASRAKGVSGNGDVVVGYVTGPSNRPQAARWTTQGGMRVLGVESVRSEANAVSADGVVVVGYIEFGSTDALIADAFRWTERTGFVPLGDLIGGRRYSVAHDVSADGSVIVGFSETLRDDGFAARGAFYWSAEMGMVNLQELLVSHGANLDGWRLSETRGVTPDGLTVVGTGVHNGRIEAFIAQCRNRPRSSWPCSPSTYFWLSQCIDGAGILRVRSTKYAVRSTTYAVRSAKQADEVRRNGATVAQ